MDHRTKFKTIKLLEKNVENIHDLGLELRVLRHDTKCPILKIKKSTN